jgi:CrcB protein
VLKFMIMVFVGGAMGAMLRELLMLIVPSVADGFPLDILAANLLASLLLGLVAALHSRQVVSDGVNMLVGTGFTGGLSTFSSFAYGVSVLIAASDARAILALAYVATSLTLGYIAVVVGAKIGRNGIKLKIP